jgi:hypothetical protein
MSHSQPANPLPAALCALSVVCFAFFALLTGRIPHEAAPALIGICFGGAVVQIIAAVMDLKHGNALGGTLFFVFGAFFMLGVSINHAVQLYAEVSGVHYSIALDGWYFLILAIILILMTIVATLANSIFVLALTCADLGVLILALVHLKLLSPAFLQLAGWLILILGIVGLYLIFVMLFNATAGKQVFPTGKPLFKKIQKEGN